MHIARDEQIYAAIAVIVRPCRSRAESTSSDASFVRHVFEFAVAEVVIKRVATIASDIDIRQSVIIVVRDRHPHAPALAGEPCRLSNVSEFESGVLAIE